MSLNFDPARKLPIYLRIGMDGSKTLNFYDANNAGFDISGDTFQVDIYERVGGSIYKSWTEATELSKPTSTSLKITFTDTASGEFRPHEYFYRLKRTDSLGIVKVWLNGPLYAHEGEFDGVTTTDSIVIDESGTAVSVVISDSTNRDARVFSTTSTATLTPDVSSYDIFEITAQAEALTIANPTGTVSDGYAFVIKVKDDGTARAITFGANYVSFGAPITTTLGKWMYIPIIYNETAGKYDVLGYKVED